MTLNVLTFGADPSGNRDSTGAFRTAVEELLCEIQDNAIYQKTSLLIPAGTYKLNGFIWGEEEVSTNDRESESTSEEVRKAEGGSTF